MRKSVLAIALHCFCHMATGQSILSLGLGSYHTPFIHNGATFDSMIRPNTLGIDADGDSVHKVDSICFSEKANFFNTKFNCLADFRCMDFRNWMDCSSAKFYGDADFSGSIIEKAGFSGTEFQKDIIFNNCKLLQTAYFCYLELSPRSNLYIHSLALPIELYFSHNPNLPYDIDLTAARHVDGVRTKLYLYRSDISKFLFDYRYFQLIFTDTLHKEHLSRDEKISIYEAALKNFKDRGQLESYRLLDIEYQGFKRGALHFIPLIWNRYGYNTEWIFYWTLFFLLVFTAINYCYLEKLNVMAYPILKDQDLRGLKDEPGPWGCRRKRAWYSFYYTACLFFPISIKVENISYKRLGLTAYILTIYTFGIICLAYLANFVLQK